MFNAENSMQVVLIYIKPCRHTLLLNCVLQPKIAKKITKTPIFGVQGP